MQYVLKICLLIACVLLVSCGGGGGGGGGVGDDDGSNSQFQCTASGVGQFNISGVVAVAPGSLLDSDTRNPNAPVIDNGSFESAQTIPSPETVNPVTVGGFASGPVQGALADTNDFYSISLLEGDLIVLEVADALPFISDLDLFLYDSNRELVGMSESAGQIEVLLAPADGLYFVEVRVWVGESSYVLTISGGISNPVAATNSLADDFVPGEIIVRYKPDSQSVPLVSAAGLNRDELEPVAGSRERIMRMRLAYSVAASSVPESGSQMRFRNSNDQRKYETLIAVKRMQQQLDVEYASVNYIRYPLVIPNDSLYGSQWNFSLIDLPAAWDLTTGDPGVVVAVIDTGINAGHPDLQGKLVGGYDFVSSTFNADDGDGLDPDPDDAANSYHGTHVAGIIAADTDNDLGVAGAGWNTRVMPVRALGRDGGTFYDILQAMLYAAGLDNDSNTVPSEPVGIINLSLGGPLSVGIPLEQFIINQVRDAGVIIIAAAGNQNNSFPFYPASYSGVVSVSAVAQPIANQDPVLAEYSSFGPLVDVTAPGGDESGIQSTFGGNNYEILRGTSMAAPHIAGVVALMQSARMAQGDLPLTPLEFDQLLEAGSLTTDLGAPGRDDQFGYGLINASVAVQAALDFDLPPPPPALAVTPGSINFGAGLGTLGFVLSNAGGGALNVISVAEFPVNTTWLEIEPTGPVGPDGLGVYLLHVDRTGLVENNYATTIRIQTDANTIDIPVNMTVASNPFAGDIGEFRVKLYFAEDLTRIDSIAINSNDGSFEFANVDSGCYVVAAGTNVDDDQFISDVGEAWGVYRSKSEFVSLILDADATNIDFEVAFDAPLFLPTGDGGGPTLVDQPAL